MKYYEEICIFNEGQGTYNPIMKERIGIGKDCYNYNHYCGESNHLTLGKKPKRYDPDFVQPSDILEFISNQDDFYEDAVYSMEKEA